MSGLADISYRSNSAPYLHWAAWNDEYVVFDEASGQTHQLDAVRAYILHLVSDRPQTLLDIVHALAELPAAPKDSITSAVVSAILGEFETCGLAEAIAQ